MNKTNTAFIKEVSAFVAPHSYNMHPIMACDASLQLNKRSFLACTQNTSLEAATNPVQNSSSCLRFLPLP
jgi:hypothetical protein